MFFCSEDRETNPPLLITASLVYNGLGRPVGAFERTGTDIIHHLDQSVKLTDVYILRNWVYLSTKIDDFCNIISFVYVTTMKAKKIQSHVKYSV